MERYRDAPTRGIFFDVFNAVPCLCGRCLAELDERGLDPDKPDDVMALGRDVLLRGMERLTRVVTRRRPAWTVFHNLGHVPRGNRRFESVSTHLELESLPTGGWG